MSNIICVSAGIAGERQTSGKSPVHAELNHDTEKPGAPCSLTEIFTIGCGFQVLILQVQ